MTKKLHGFTCNSCSEFIYKSSSEFKDWKEWKSKSGLLAHLCPKCQRGEGEKEVVTDFYNISHYSDRSYTSHINRGETVRKAPT